MRDLIVKDEEYTGVGEKYEKIGTTAEKQLDQYFSILEAIAENAVSDGVVFTNLKTFISQAQMIKGQISDLTKKAKEAYNTYVSEIDDNDEYIY